MCEMEKDSWGKEFYFHVCKNTYQRLESFLCLFVNYFLTMTYRFNILMYYLLYIKVKFSFKCKAYINVKLLLQICI